MSAFSTRIHMRFINPTAICEGARRNSCTGSVTAALARRFVNIATRFIPAICNHHKAVYQVTPLALAAFPSVLVIAGIFVCYAAPACGAVVTQTAAYTVLRAAYVGVFQAAIYCSCIATDAGSRMSAVTVGRVSVCIVAIVGKAISANTAVFVVGAIAVISVVPIVTIVTNEVDGAVIF